MILGITYPHNPQDLHCPCLPCYTWRKQLQHQTIQKLQHQVISNLETMAAQQGIPIPSLIKEESKMQYRISSKIRNSNTANQPGGAIYLTIVLTAISIDSALRIMRVNGLADNDVTKIEAIGFDDTALDKGTDNG